MKRNNFKQDIEINKASCYELFIKSKRKNRSNFLANSYVIPDLQRKYVWRKEQVERMLEAVSNREGKYLGNIVVLPGKGGIDFLVDGQQRLVTISLLCKVLSEKAVGASLKRKLEQILFRDGSPRISFSDNNLNSFYKDFILNNNPDHFLDSQKIINNSISYLRKSLILKNLSNDKKINIFFKKVVTLQFGVIRCNNIADIYNLFEGLNSTGVSLTSVEKTKNSIFGKLYELGGEKEFDKGRKIWNKIEKNFEQSNIFWINKFLRHQWFLIGGKESEKNLFNRINDRKIKPSKNTSELFEYLNKLFQDSVIYSRLKTGNLNEGYFPRNCRKNAGKDIVDLLIFINRLELDQVYPVLLALYNYGKINEKYFNDSRFFEHLRKLAAFSLLAKYGKVIPSQYETKFANLCLDLTSLKYSDFKKRTKIFFDGLVGLVGDSSKKFIKNFNNNYLDNKDRLAKQIFICLFKIRKNYKYTTEHILPKGIDGRGNFEFWANVPQVNHKKLANYIFKIGNLTLIEEKLNSDEAKNFGFIDKVRVYEKSGLAENRKIKVYKKFNSRDPSKAILERGKKLSSLIFDAYYKILSE